MDVFTLNQYVTDKINGRLILIRIDSFLFHFIPLTSDFQLQGLQWFTSAHFFSSNPTSRACHSLIDVSFYTKI